MIDVKHSAVLAKRKGSSLKLHSALSFNLIKTQIRLSDYHETYYVKMKNVYVINFHTSF